MSKKWIRSSTTVVALIVYMVVMQAGLIHLCGCDDGTCAIAQATETETGCGHCSGTANADGNAAIENASVSNQCSCDTFSVSNHVIEVHEQSDSTQSNMRHDAASFASVDIDIDSIDSFFRVTHYPQRLIQSKTIQSLRIVVIVA